MTKLWKYTYYGYLIIALILIVEGILQFGKDIKMALILLAIAGAVILKFFFTRKFRKRIAERTEQK
ncbi:hypothetical protein [Pseudotenacibaculum haliotis]|uniref:Uncharacterized protein n=1 Tax=Pseudotenacibaculum haliotis TaxID=1862138 RepID=A0ABW5LXT8_9FLAO